MWVEIKKANSLMIAEMWKEAFEGEGRRRNTNPHSTAIRRGAGT